MESEFIAEESVKKGRRRKKLLYSSILQLMEFYFSDSNLSKDRFLSQLLQTDPYIDISVFLNFNKIRKLTNDTTDIKKAIRKSEIIKLSADQTKITRKTEIKIKTNVDECTIYVENIKPDATHEWLSSVFSELGKVVYISLPKYKHTRMNKGFAFVEFENENDVKHVIEFFEDIDCKISSQMCPEELCSIVTYNRGEDNNMHKHGCSSNEPFNKITIETTVQPKTSDLSKECKSKQNRSSDLIVESSDELSMSNIETEQNSNSSSSEKQISKKRKRSQENEKIHDSHVSEEYMTKLKKQRHDKHLCKVKELNINQLLDKHSNKDNEKDYSIKTTSENNELNEHNINESIIFNDDLKKKKKTLRIMEANSDENQIHDENEPQLKKIRIKEDMHKQSFDKDMKIGNDGENLEKKRNKEISDKKKKKIKKKHIKELGLQVLSKQEWKKMRNKYLDTQRKKMKQLKQYFCKKPFSGRVDDKEKCDNKMDMNCDLTTNKQIDPKNKNNLITLGTIVKIELPKPCPDTKQFKIEVKAFSNDVKYVDASIGNTVAYIRFGDNETAKTFCESKHYECCFILEGDEEKIYWDKVFCERNNKNQKDCKKLRGRAKLLKRAEKERGKHIKFDDADV